MYVYIYVYVQTFFLIGGPETLTICSHQVNRGTNGWTILKIVFYVVMLEMSNKPDSHSVTIIAY